MKIHNKLIISAITSCALYLPFISYGEALPIVALKLFPQNAVSFNISAPPTLTITGTTQCPGIGTAAFPLDTLTNTVGINDVIDFTGTNGQVVFEIAHSRSDNFEGANSAAARPNSKPFCGGNVTNIKPVSASPCATFLSTNPNNPRNGTVLNPSACSACIQADDNVWYLRQDWTRFKINNGNTGINDTTGTRFYIGNFGTEYQKTTPSATKVVIAPAGNGNITGYTTSGQSTGIINVNEPISFPASNKLANVASRVDAVSFIGPQSGWIEPFQVSDNRICTYLNTTSNRRLKAFPVSTSPINYNTRCIVNGNKLIRYNGVSFRGNIVGCPS